MYIIIAEWSKALVLWTADSEFKPAGEFCLIEETLSRCDELIEL